MPAQYGLDIVLVAAFYGFFNRWRLSGVISRAELSVKLTMSQDATRVDQ